MTCVPFIDFLNQRLLPKLVLPATAPECIDLLETKNREPDLLSQVSLYDLGNFVAINHDSVDGLDVREIIPVKDLFKKCDAIILGQKNDRPYILVIDLKSKSLKIENHKKKMRAGKLFIEMLNLFLQEYKDVFCHDQDLRKWEKHYIILHCNVQKSTTGNLVPEIPNTHLNPRYIFTLDKSKLSLNTLLGEKKLLLV